MTTGGSAKCWGADWFGQSTIKPNDLVQISAGSNYTCGVTSKGRVKCWGYNKFGQAAPP